MEESYIERRRRPKLVRFKQSLRIVDARNITGERVVGLNLYFSAAFSTALFALSQCSHKLISGRTNSVPSQNLILTRLVLSVNLWAQNGILCSCLLSTIHIYGQHSAGKTFVAISKFLIVPGSGWETFMHLLCLFLELTIDCDLSSSHKASALAEKKNSNYDSSIPNWSLTSKPESAKCYVVTAIIRVLRNILKYLKQYCDSRTMKIYLDSVASLLLNVSWEILSEILVDCNAEASDKDVSLHSKLVHPREMEMLRGILLQFVYSFVDQIDQVEDGVRPSADICQINDLLFFFAN
ncbi:uncharacterized protein LOC142538326 [Primulina tabacum]|uniref:uncharacterized protein LOC142538326 n=1 Tax=Primulina tabacum TaxID=48773 RepID=UPI003F5934D2